MENMTIEQIISRMRDLNLMYGNEAYKKSAEYNQLKKLLYEKQVKEQCGM